VTLTLSYLRPDEEFFGAIKLCSGEEIIGRVIVCEENGSHLAFIQDPAKVHVNEHMIEGKRALAVGLKRWMVFASEDFYIIPEDKILTVAPLTQEAIIMYKYFVKSELGNIPGINDSAKTTKMNQEMGFIGDVDAARKKLEDLFGSDK